MKKLRNAQFFQVHKAKAFYTMKNLILVLMAMLLMAGMASAGFIAFYKATTTPYKMLEYAGAPERVNIDWEADYDVIIDFSDSCDVSDSTPFRGIDGRIPCVDARSPYVSMTFPFRGPVVTTKEVYASTSDTINLSSALFDVFYKTTTSPYKMRAFLNATRIEISGTAGQTANVDFRDSCDASDAIDPAVDSDGRIPCMDVRTDTARITVSSYLTGEEVLTKEVFIYMHPVAAAPVTPPAVTPTCSDSDPANDVHVLGNVNGINSAGEEYIITDHCPIEVSTSIFEVECNELGGVAVSTEDCPTGEFCVGGICERPAPPTISCDPPCTSAQVCVDDGSGTGTCVNTIDRVRDRRWEEIIARIRGIKQHLNNIEKSACGTGLPTGKAVAATNAVTVNSFSNLEVELTKIYEQQARIAKCKGLASAKFTKTANSETNVAALIALTTKQTYDLKKATLKAGGVKAKATADKAPALEATKTPAVKTVAKKTPVAAAKKSFFGRLFGK